MSENDEISEPVMNVFEVLDLPFEAKAVEIADSVLHGKFHFPALVPAIAAALREERERCAAIAQGFGKVSETLDPSSKNTVSACAFNIAAAIMDGSTTDERHD